MRSRAMAIVCLTLRERRYGSNTILSLKVLYVHNFLLLSALTLKIINKPLPLPIHGVHISSIPGNTLGTKGLKFILQQSFKNR